MPVLRLFLLSGCCTLLQTASVDDWTYHPGASQAAFRTQSVILPLSEQRPEDVDAAQIATPGTRFGQFRFGSFDSGRIVVAVVPQPNGPPHLYLDANRDRKLTQKERHDAAGNVWSVNLNADFLDGFLVNSDERKLRFRYSNGILIYGTVGFIEGKTRLDERTVGIRRVDANANGRFSDSEDELWVDHNSDGTWDAFTERFSFAPMLRVADKRYSTLTDVRSQVFAMEANTQTGLLTLQVPEELKQRGLEKLNVVMAGRTGSLVNLNLNSPSARVPVDEYRAVSLVATFERTEFPPVWTYTFVNRTDTAANWTEVTEDSDAKCDPLRSIQLSAKLDRADGSYATGGHVRITPVLSTTAGLELQGAYYGRESTASAGEPTATVTLGDPIADQQIGVRSSGFN